MATHVAQNKLHAHDLEDLKLPGGGHSHNTPLIIRRQPSGNRKPMVFTSLHHHSTFSYKDGYQLPEAHVRRAVELRMENGLAMTEHGNTDSHVKFEVAALKQGIKPIFGCEVYTGKVGEGATQHKYHLTLLAKNAEGYRNLIKLVTTAWAEGFYYDPTVSWEMLKRHKKGLVVLSGCLGSLLACSAVGGKLIPEEEASYRRALDVARQFKKVFGRNYFIEVQAFPELAKTNKLNPILARIARRLGIRLVATMDCHYTMLEESEVQMILHNIRGGNKQTLEEQARAWGYDVPQCPPPNDRSIMRRLQQTGLTREESIEAIVSTEEIAAECKVELPKLDMIRFPVPVGFDSLQEFWEHKLKEGWKFRGYDKLPPAMRAKARKQLQKEKAIMESKDFLDYLLWISDVVTWVKDEGWFVGPARGSSAASIICYCLRITEVNPLDFDNLVFERFIDVTREDLPDIDLDFPSEVRPLMRQYLEGKLGEGCVNNVGTFTYFKSKLALDDVARVYRIPQTQVNRIKDFLIERSSGDLRASSTIEDTVAQFPQAQAVFDEFPELKKSELLEGNIKGFGVHAAGLALSNKPLVETGVSAVYSREVPKGSGNIVQVVSLDKYDAERQGLVKMDFLGLSTASQIESASKILGMTPDDWYGLPLDDPKTLRIFQDNDVTGVFQFDGRACRYVNSTILADNFDEICDVTALARPGALHNGAATAYADFKHGRDVPVPIHPVVDEVLSPTQYQIVYQEQILKLVREVGNFPWTAAAEIRAIIAKKHGNAAFNRKKAEFMKGAKTLHKRRKGTPPLKLALADALWGNMITAGSYSFNASHARSYGLLSFYTAWLKAHHIDVFYSTALALPNVDDEKQIDLLRDAHKHGVRILNPSAARSGATWKPVRKKKRALPVPTVRAGFEQIDGVGEKTAQAIVEYRDEEGMAGWDDLLNVKGIGAKTVEKIKDWVKLDDPFGALKLERDIKNIKADIRSGALPLPTPTHKSTEIPESRTSEIGVVWIGTIVHRNVRDIFEANRKKGEALDPATVKAPHLNEFLALKCEDDEGQLLVFIDRFVYPKFKQAVFDCKMRSDIIVVDGVRPRGRFGKMIKVKNLWVIEP